MTDTRLRRLGSPGGRLRAVPQERQQVACFWGELRLDNGLAHGDAPCEWLRGAGLAPSSGSPRLLLQEGYQSHLMEANVRLAGSISPGQAPPGRRSGYAGWCSADAWVGAHLHVRRRWQAVAVAVQMLTRIRASIQGMFEWHEVRQNS